MECRSRPDVARAPIRHLVRRPRLGRRPRRDGLHDDVVVGCLGRCLRRVTHLQKSHLRHRPDVEAHGDRHGRAGERREDGQRCDLRQTSRSSLEGLLGQHQSLPFRSV